MSVMLARRHRTCAVAAVILLYAWGCEDSSRSPDPSDPEDRLAPAAVNDLSVRDGDDGVVLTWTAVGDDSLTGTADAYDLRWIVADSSGCVWDRGTPVAGLPHPSPPGRLDAVRVTGIPDSGVFCFRLRTMDDAGNWSGDSNTPFLYRMPESPPDSSWTSVASPGFPVAAVDAIEIGGNWLYALVRRDDAVQSTCILRGSEAAWEEIESGLLADDSLGSGILCLSADEGRLAAGGSFRSRADRRMQGIAEWSGDAWRPLGDGIEGIVRALARYEGELVAAGEFFLGEGIGAQCIAAWDGSAWRAMGDGLVGPVHALAAGPAGILAAGGSFMRTGERMVSHVALWDGAQWSDAAGGLPYPVIRLVWLSDRLVAVVRPTADPYDFGDIYVYDGTGWTPIHSQDYWFGAENVAIAADAHGSLFVCWTFRSVRIRSWDGLAWRDLARPPLGSVGALVFRDGEMIAGGRPWDEISCFARWRPR